MKAGSYRPQLDGLRAIAVLGVVFQHFAPPQWSRVIPWGGLGVTLFFVLSGYLITGILLKGRTDAEDAGLEKGGLLKHFYIRRALRIFPVYYAVLLAAALYGIPPVRETFWWHALYVSNILFALKNSYFGSVSPFWSLAVEQHFYVIWPWIVLLIPRRHLLATFITAMIGGLLFRLSIHAAGWNTIAVNVLTPAAFEPFGIGALLAWIEFQRHPLPLTKAPLIAGLALMPAALYLSWTRSGTAIQMIVGSLAWGPLFFWMIRGASHGFGGWVGQLLQSKPVVYLGQISYGIYLMHNLVFSQITTKWEPALPGARAMIAFVLTVILSTISYEYLEKPVRKLKVLFPYNIRIRPRMDLVGQHD